MRQLKTLQVKGFKSIREQELNLTRLNLLIGGNGVGKSNLIAVFKLVRELHDRNLQVWTGKAGGADTVLHFGRKRTPQMEIGFRFEEGDRANEYHVQLEPTQEDSLIVTQEWVAFQNMKTHPQKPYTQNLAAGVSEATIAKANNKIAQYVREDLGSYRIYHFHDTSGSAAVKQHRPLDENVFLQADASNLAAFLYRLQQSKQSHLVLIEDTIRQIAPFFDGFALAPSRLNSDRIRLEWREKGSDNYFNAHQLSDGTLRFICLTTLLLQPELPRMILLDEPELGLHPAAIQLLAELFKRAAEHSQLLVSTQSVTLINQFDPDQVWVADREEAATVFSHLAQRELDQWMEQYALGELWEKNVLGGRP